MRWSERRGGRQGRGNRSACLGANSPPITVGAAGRGGRATALHLPQHQDVPLLLLHLNGRHFIILLSLGRAVVDRTKRGEKIKQTGKQNQTNPNPKTAAKRKWHFSQVAFHHDFFKDPEKMRSLGKNLPLMVECPGSNSTYTSSVRET